MSTNKNKLIIHEYKKSFHNLPALAKVKKGKIKKAAFKSTSARFKTSPKFEKKIKKKAPLLTKPSKPQYLQFLSKIV